MMGENNKSRYELLQNKTILAIRSKSLMLSAICYRRWSNKGFERWHIKVGRGSGSCVS